MITYSVTLEVTIGVHGLATLAIITVTIVAVVALTSRRDSRRTVPIENVTTRDTQPASGSHDEQPRPRRLARTRRWVGRLAEEMVITGLAGLLTNRFTLSLQIGVVLFTGG